MDKKVYTKYVNSMNKFEGWFFGHNLFAGLDTFQKEKNFEGDIFEIGVYQGKSSILLSCMRREEEILSVCDLFEEQTNPQTSRGNYEKFIENFSSFFGNCERLFVYREKSENLRAGQIGNSYRFFHIDGAHDATSVEKDLTLANNVVNDSGCVLMDDYFNPKKPGVSEGALRFLFDNQELVPFFIGFNKVGLCRPEYHQNYLEYILSGKDEYIVSARKKRFSLKIVNFLNYNIGVLPGA